MTKHTQQRIHFYLFTIGIYTDVVCRMHIVILKEYRINSLIRGLLLVIVVRIFAHQNYVFNIVNLLSNWMLNSYFCLNSKFVCIYLFLYIYTKTKRKKKNYNNVYVFKIGYTAQIHRASREVFKTIRCLHLVLNANIFLKVHHSSMSACSIYLLRFYLCADVNFKFIGLRTIFFIKFCSVFFFFTFFLLFLFRLLL